MDELVARNEPIDTRLLHIEVRSILSKALHPAMKKLPIVVTCESAERSMDVMNLEEKQKSSRIV